MFLVWLALLLNAASPILVGRVSDGLGKPVSHAAVRLITVDGRTLSSTTTNDRGGFRFEVSSGFQLEIQSPGFRTVQSDPISLPRDGIYQFEVALSRGNPAEMDRVELQLQSVDDPASRTDPGAREALPKSDRLLGLRGGVNVSKIAEGSGQQWVAATGNVFTSSAMTVTVGDNADFSADLGDSVAIDDTLPPGEDTLHGNIHYFHRNDIFNARNFFDPPEAPIPPFKYDFFGGDSGGRIREGTYFYGQYWGLRIRQSITRTATVPDPAWLRGDFSAIPETLTDPETGFVFAANQIPRNRFNSSGLALAVLYPQPNVPGAVSQNYTAVAKLNTVADSFGFRLDHRLTLSDEAFVEYQYSRDTTDDPFNLLSGITNLPSYGVRDALQTHSLRIHNTHVFSPTVVDQLRFSMAYLKQPRTILSSAVQPAILMTGPSHLGHAPNLPQERRNRSFEVINEIALQHPKSATKIGGSFRYFPFHASMALYSRGQYQFTGGVFTGHAFANLLLGFPTNALRIQGDTSRDFRTWTSSAYVQHDWQPRTNLSANVGLRYDYQSPFKEAHGKVANFDVTTGGMRESPHTLYDADRNNFGPRVGVAWRPPLKDVLVRAGYGIFFDTLAVGDSLFLLGLNPPFVHFDLENNGPVVPLFNIDTAFSSSTGSTHPSVFSTSSQLPNPYVQQWSATIERPLPWDLDGEISYFGQKGTRLRRQLNLNQPTAGSAGTLDERRPFPELKNIFQFETSAASIAHALELRLARRFQGQFGLGASYRFSRLIDDATLISVLPQNSRDLRAERGLADFHAKHRLSFQLSANLPGSDGDFAPLLRNWQFHGIGLLQSGMPLSAVLTEDIAGTGSPIVNRPDLLRNPNTGVRSATHFFDTDAFRTPEPGNFGNSGRNVIIGPGIWNADMAVSRVFRMSDLTRLQFRADAYNVFNHPNFVAPPSMQNIADSPDFGVLFVARSPRIMQFGLKFLW